MKGKENHLIVISYDAFSEDNWDIARKQPNLAKLIKHGAYSTKLKSVYPSLTYVVHSTMVTGVYPNKHGIYHNNPFQPFVEEKDQRWFWFHKDIKVNTIYDALRKYNMKSTGILWPVTGKAPIHYNIPEIRAIKNENQVIKSLVNGSPLFSIEMELKFGRIRKGIEQPYLDDFTTKCAVESIKKNKPNLMLLHMIDLDDAKHQYGTDSIKIEEVITRMDQRVGDIVKAVEESGLKEDTVFLILGDHGQLNVRYKVNLNVLLKEKGLIVQDDGNLKWRAYVQSAGGSAYLHIREGDEEAKQMALSVILQAVGEKSYGIEGVLLRKELDKLHVDSTIHCMLEAKKGFCFEDGIDSPVIKDLHKLGVPYATHGYLPEKENYHCNLIISGKRIKNDYFMGEIDMVDIAPTMASILGIEFYPCDGKAHNEIFE